VQDVVAKMYASPPNIVTRAREALQPQSFTRMRGAD